MLRSEILQLLAVSAGVVPRSDKDHVVLTGALPTGDTARVKLAPGSAEFSLPYPVEKDPTSGLVTGVKSFGPDAKELADKVLKGMEKRGFQVQASEPQPIDSTMEISLVMYLNLMLRFLCRTACLMTVATLGDIAIASQSEEQYRRATNTVGLTRDTLIEIGIGGTFWTSKGIPTSSPTSVIARRTP